MFTHPDWYYCSFHPFIFCTTYLTKGHGKPGVYPRRIGAHIDTLQYIQFRSAMVTEETRVCGGNPRSMGTTFKLHARSVEAGIEERERESVLAEPSFGT